MSAAQLSLEDLFAEAPEPTHRPTIPGAFDVYVAHPEFVGSDADRGPLPVQADSIREAESKAAALAGVDADACLALPSRDPSWFDRLTSSLERANQRAEEDIAELRKLHADILGCSVDELDAKVAEEKAKQKAELEAIRASRPPRPARKRAGRAAAPVVAEPAAPPTSRLDDRQRELLSLVRVEGNVARYTGTEHIDDWNALKRVMTALGGKWRARKGFVFADDVDAAEAVRLALETGEVLDPVAAGFFPTPAALAARVVELAEVRAGDAVLEPSAGRGAIARAARDAGGVVKCAELLPDNVKALRAEGFDVVDGDFLAMAPSDLGTFDRVAMNPPFGKRADIAHVRHALSFLRPGGRLVAIMSAGVAYRDDRLARDFRALVEERGGEILDNPDGSFLESGTCVRTVTVTMRGDERA